MSNWVTERAGPRAAVRVWVYVCVCCVYACKRERAMEREAGGIELCVLISQY